MGGTDEDDDLKLVQASAGLLADLETDLSKVLYQTSPTQSRRAHRHVKRRDLNRLVQLIEPFQGEPQLLDARLKSILPPIVDAYLEHLRHDNVPESAHVDLQSAVCTLLYTLCKVRGYKVVVGFLSNEPRYLEPILRRLEHTISSTKTGEAVWQVTYVLLLWLSHLLLTPFDLSSISATEPSAEPDTFLNLHKLPQLAKRVLRVGLTYLRSPTKAQDAAAAMLVRLAIRPDVVRLDLAEALLDAKLPYLARDTDSALNTYEVLGALRLVAGIAAANELNVLIPRIYDSCETAFEDEQHTTLAANAVAKKIAIKTLRNIAIMSLRSASADGQLLHFLQSTSMIESVVDYLLRALGDKDTPVRYAAAKGISLLVLELDRDMGHEVIQAVLESFKEDIPRSATAMDFTTVNALKWHGLTLALAHALFKRSASTEQLPDILDALISALQFQQRTSTGTTLGTNIRDAANFGIWSLARRYTTAELLSVSVNDLLASNRVLAGESVIQVLATQLILSACLDPAGNVRRGSSAALQEVVGRHPDQVTEGIPLVQVVDYQAVSLRSRAMIDVANNAAALHPQYWRAALDATYGWRGLGSADVLSRESAARSIAKLASGAPHHGAVIVLDEVLQHIQECLVQEVERLHGFALAAADIVEAHRSGSVLACSDSIILKLKAAFVHLYTALKEFSPRILRSEYPAAIARYTTALCRLLLIAIRRDNCSVGEIGIELDRLVDRLLARHDEFILTFTPGLVRSVFDLQQATDVALDCITVHALSRTVVKDGSKSTLHSAGRAFALGALAASYDSAGLIGDDAVAAVTTLCGLLHATNVDWRMIGARALQLVVNSVAKGYAIDPVIAGMMCEAMHRGLNDYTIDERGDVGSLVRLQCIACAEQMLGTRLFMPVDALEQEICRLSLEKLDRVRLQAALCRHRHIDISDKVAITDIASVSSTDYFRAALSPIWTSTDAPAQLATGVIQGTISCAGAGAEPLIQASRHVLFTELQACDAAVLQCYLEGLMSAIKEQLTSSAANLQPALEILAFLLDMQIAQRLSSSTTFNWRTLLSIVQKSHHKSNDIPKILAAVHCYIGLASMPAVRAETLKKLVSMLKTNPYPNVRNAVAEALYVITGDEALEKVNWSRPAKENLEVVEELGKYVDMP
ncbi:Putative armadillo-like helical, tubulin-specific chaperone D, tubulin-folding cofactor D [Septoria linicola]|uniref:Armadillo-like helical, tubulin-specific chaperone D, tubulin-folding cofactor D n=1 Tax=Septoria linicola TaxID=215465 RepID=A0A9Q9EN72_9PEZI|nr:putative armadillo-like helical, tubulin-specific chaperone D, tubulin-folding cofactor D [Septoria linicola]USW56775.1 Putative armadillo-like helical, tubulin-specific chaperone D, tubulin-folding cofactor D [Septoria linicola]